MGNPTETFPRFTPSIEHWTEQFRMEISDYVRPDRYFDIRAQVLVQMFQIDADTLATIYVNDPVPLAIALSAAVKIIPEYVIPERRLWHLHRDEVAELLARHQLHCPKPMVAIGDHELVSLFLLQLLQTAAGLRLYYQVALVLEAVSRQPDLRKYFS